MIDRLKEISQRWDKVEVRLKEIEQISGEARIPAINELRYAGRQLVDALGKTPNDKFGIETHVRNAELYVRNADHDITDAIADFIKGRINFALSEYGETNVLRAFPRALEIKVIAEDIETKTKNSRGDRATRDKTYDDIYTNDVTRMIDLYKQYDRARPLILYHAVKLEKKYQISKWFNLLVGIGGLFGVAITVFSWIVPYAEFKLWLLSTLTRIL